MTLHTLQVKKPREVLHPALGDFAVYIKVSTDNVCLSASD